MAIIKEFTSGLSALLALTCYVDFNIYRQSHLDYTCLHGHVEHIQRKHEILSDEMTRKKRTPLRVKLVTMD